MMIQVEWLSLPVYLHPVLLSTLMALVAIVLASKITRVSQAEKAYQAFLYEYDTQALSGWVSASAGSRYVRCFPV